MSHRSFKSNSVYLQIEEKLPQYGEKNSLQSVGEDAGLQAATQKPPLAIFANDSPRGFRCETLLATSGRLFGVLYAQYETLVSLTCR